MKRVVAAFVMVLFGSQFSILLLAQTAPPPALGDLPSSTRAITGTASSARFCLSGNAANVHNLGWMEAGSGYTVTFDANFTVTATVVRLDLAGQRAAVANGTPELNFTASTPGTAVLHVTGRGQTGCYRYNLVVDPPSPSALTEATAGARGRSSEVSARPLATTVGPTAISGTPSSAQHCVSNAFVANVHEIGRVDQGSQVTITFDTDFDAIAGVTMTSLDTGTGTTSFVVDDNSGGNGAPSLNFTAGAATNLALHVAAVSGSGCYSYKVEIR